MAGFCLFEVFIFIIALKCFHLGFIFLLFFFFFAFLYILYESIYDTHVNIVIFLLLIWTKTTERRITLAVWLECFRHCVREVIFLSVAKRDGNV